MELMEKNPILALRLQGMPIVPSSLRHKLPQLQDVLIAYGVGDGYLYEECRTWLHQDPQRQLIWIAADLQDAARCRSSSDPQVTLCTLDEPEVLKKALYPCVGKKISTSVLDSYDGEPAQNMVENMLGGIELLLAKSADFGVKSLKNTLRNLGIGSAANGLFDTCKNVPAVVCGAGPSLQTHVNSLRDWQNKTLIFAGGSALKPLLAMGIRPHFGMGVDPDPDVEKVCVDGCDVPFFYTSSFSADVLEAFSGPKYWVQHTGAMRLEQWLFRESCLGGQVLDLGWTVGNATVAVAVALGCNPIILVGMDAVCKEGEIDVVDKEGRLAKSRKDLMASNRWLKEFIAMHPEVEFIDQCAGLDFGGQHKAVEFGPLTIQLPQLPQMQLKKTQAIEQSFERCHKLCQGAPAPRSWIELTCELVYIELLRPLWEIWKPVLSKTGSLEMQEWLFYQRVLKAYES